MYIWKDVSFNQIRIFIAGHKSRNIVEMRECFMREFFDTLVIINLIYQPFEAIRQHLHNIWMCFFLIRTMYIYILFFCSHSQHSLVVLLLFLIILRESFFSIAFSQSQLQRLTLLFWAFKVTQTPHYKLTDEVAMMTRLCLSKPITFLLLLLLLR